VFDKPQVVSDEEIRQLQALFQIEQQSDYLRLDRDVQRRDRLVGDDQSWIERERAGDADALPLSPAELVRKPQHVRRLEANQLEEFGDAGTPLGFVPRRWMTSGSSTMSPTRMRGLSDE
jgi:hypothetical protein